ncbi:hypothetical protein [Psychrobacillus sp. L3]|uniref:hypothetical protein n=1 Tax=Psychrobacillus sp. L3 TaxID=3236891 RepID=UPI0036F249AB
MSCENSVPINDAVEYQADVEGTQLNFQALSEVVTSFRIGKKLDRAWKKDIEKDFKNRPQHARK